MQNQMRLRRAWKPTLRKQNHAYLRKLKQARIIKPSLEKTQALLGAALDEPGLIPDADQPLDILLPLGPFSNYDDLETRITLRTIFRYGRGWSRIFIVGHRPQWLKTNDRLVHVPADDIKGNHEARIAFKLIWSFENTDVANHAVLWNDDYVLQATRDLSCLEFWHAQELNQAAKIRTMQDRYWRALLMTEAYLKACGLKALHYDVHVPMIYSRKHFLALRPWWEESLSMECGLVTKSVYCNVYLRDNVGPTINDCKMVRWGDIGPELIARRWIWSYGDPALGAGLHPWLLKTFNEPSPWE